MVLDTYSGINCCNRCGSSPNHFGFVAVLSKSEVVLKGRCYEEQERILDATAQGHGSFTFHTHSVATSLSRPGPPAFRPSGEVRLLSIYG